MLPSNQKLIIVTTTEAEGVEQLQPTALDSEETATTGTRAEGCVMVYMHNTCNTVQPRLSELKVQRKCRVKYKYVVDLRIEPLSHSCLAGTSRCVALKNSYPEV
jgi:hypothetical protein